jgi:hypothetical protein
MCSSVDEINSEPPGPVINGFPLLLITFYFMNINSGFKKIQLTLVALSVQEPEPEGL